jgi:alpha-tubulin suppressor-like RCC1 family protein
VSGLSSGLAKVEAGVQFTCARTVTSGARCWGQNAFGQLGDGTVTNRSTPGSVDTLTNNVSRLATGAAHACAILNDGTVRCWGNNTSGQVGDGTTITRSSPINVVGLADIEAVAAGDGHTCAMTTGGAVLCWGDNNSGQLGDNSNRRRASPTAVVGLSAGVVAIAAGSAHTCALTNAGAVRCWGSNRFGQLGNNSTENWGVPSAVIGLSSGVVGITAGNDHSCALTLAGAVLCWGVNDDSELGDNSTVMRLSPVAVAGLSSGIVRVSSQRDNTCGVRNDGAVLCWGANGWGQLGDGTVAGSRPFPAYVMQVFEPQTITFLDPGSKPFGSSPTLGASASSGLPVSFSSGTTSICSITPSGLLTPLQTGQCTIHADQPGSANFWPATRVSRTFLILAVAPDAPIIGSASAGEARAVVSFSAPQSNGGAAITSYTVASNPGGLTGTGAASPITVTGLTNGTPYTFTVTATNSTGTGAPSAASNSVTPFVSTAATVLRADRAIVRENSGAVEISVLANDSIDPALANVAVLSIATAPARGTASVLTRGTASVLDDVIRYTPAVNTSGADSLVYRVCFGGAAPCVDGRLSIELRPLGLGALEFDASADRGFRDQTLAGLRALPTARFDAHGLVVPVTTDAVMSDASDAGAPWGAGRTVTVVRTLAAGTAARDWRVLVDARGTSGGDIDLFLGVDSNGNGVADASELVCSSAMSMSERCDLALTAPANGSARYWALAYSSIVGQSARLEIFETALDVPAANRTLVATAPGALAAGESFPVRLAWNDATFLPGQSRGGWLQVRADEGTSLGWVPVRINRTAGEPGAFALESGVDHVLALQAAAAHERLYIDVPPGATQLAVTTTSASNVDLYLARVDTPAASGATPTIAAAPARNQAVASAVTGSGNESLAVSNPAAGRWYVTPVNASAGAATLTVRATVTAVAPQVRAGGYFNPLRSGNGLFLYPAGSELAGLWYTYLQDGTPTWYYLQAAAPGANGLWRGIIYRSAWNGSSNRLTAVGQATVTPTTTGAFTFNYSVDGETGSEAYSNFSGACPTVSGTPLDISGHWFDPLRSGSGYSVQSFPDYEFYLVFGYDAQGVPRYLVAERSGFGSTIETLALEQLRGVCPLCTRTGNPTRTTVGTLQRRIEGGSLRNITLSATYVNGVPGTWAANDAVIPLGNLRGCSL